LIIEEINYVNSFLEEKQFFFTDIKREGKVLFNSGNFKLSESKELTPTRRREIAEEDFKNWFKQAIEFYDSFEHKSHKGSYQLASFMLQQVVEMCYTTIEMVFTHYNPYEHNLKELKKRVLVFDKKINNILPYETAKQRELFDYLNFAYIGGRYRSEEDFPVTKGQIDYWSKEAEKLLKLTEIICQERIDCLREIENKN
jgi:HEPN domain-containing protein